MRLSQKLNNALDEEFDASEYMIKQLTLGNKKQRTARRTHKRAARIVRSVNGQ